MQLQASLFLPPMQSAASSPDGRISLALTPTHPGAVFDRMSSPLIPHEQDCSRTPPAIPKPSLPTQALYQTGYQQALKDFAVSDLLHQIKTYSDANFDAAWVALKAQEAETLAAVLIQTLTANLNGNLLAVYLDAIRSKTLDVSNPFPSLHLPPLTTDLPATFPDVEMPRFLYGDRLRWLSNGEPTDWGVAIGRFYSFAPHCCRWQWCYLIWLDPSASSSAWVKTDLAWEEDLQAYDLIPADGLTEH